MKVRPLNDYLFVEPTEEKEKVTSFGVIIPDTAKEKPQKGKVQAVYPDCEIKVGSIVLYKKWGGNEVEFEDKKCLLISEEDILAVVEEE